MDPSNSPAIPPPAGTQSNIYNPASRTILTIVPSAVIVGIMIIAVFARCYTKVYVVKSTGVAEINVGIIVGCMPTFPALYKEVSSQLSAAWKHRKSSQVPKSSLKSSVGQSQQKKPSNRIIPEPVKPKVPPKDHIVELEASYPPEPMSHFSDDSSDLERA
ncbi:MAG: hypothetical protein Q9214_003671 [Letrouitia sp. 1 TL-2023]